MQRATSLGVPAMRTDAALRFKKVAGATAVIWQILLAAERWANVASSLRLVTCRSIGRVGEWI
jgi:hypothetical protein